MPTKRKGADARKACSDFDSSLAVAYGTGGPANSSNHKIKRRLCLAWQVDAGSARLKKVRSVGSAPSAIEIILSSTRRRYALGYEFEQP